MPRVKRGPKRKNRRAKVLKLAKGFYGMRSRGHRIAQQAVDKALNSAFTGRKDRKGDFRKLWITRINAAARKVLADIAVRDAAAFAALAESAKSGLQKAASK